MAAHPHARSLALYAEDASQTDEPWKRWEFRLAGDESWISANFPLSFTGAEEYRRKPKPLELWVNIYSDGRRINHNDERRALNAADSDPTGSLLRAAVHMREVTE